MYRILFYRDINNHQPVKAFIQDLASKKGKESRIQLNKIRDYMKILELEGLGAGEPFIKHLDGEIWELRPLKERILFASWNGGSFILLSVFHKKTRKTPKKEIEKAKRRYTDFIERSADGDAQSDRG